MPEPTDIFDRLIFVSFQPDKRRGAESLARAFIRSLARTNPADGWLVAQLDELVGADELLVAGTALLPPAPVALALTGSPGLVATIARSLSAGTRTRYVRLRSPHGLSGLRPGVLLREGRAWISVDREFRAIPTEKLARAGWRVQHVTDGDDALLEADGILESTAAIAPSPLPVVPPRHPTAQRPRKTRGGLAAVAGLRPKKAGRVRGRQE